MLEAFLSIIDRLIRLKEYRNKRLQNVYQNLLDPVFNDLLTVHRDYIQMFEKVHGLLYLNGMYETGKIPDNEYVKKVSEATEYLRERRIEFEPMRVKLMATIAELQEVNPPNENRKLKLNPEAHKFVNAVLFYLRSPYLEKPLGGGFSSHSTKLLEELVDFGSKPPEKIMEANFIAQALEEEYSPMHAHLQLRESLEKKIKRLRVNWSLVCEAYVQLKVSVVTEV
jgi:hypothetical protein